MPKAWEPTAEATIVEVLDSFTIRGDGTGSLRIRVDGEEWLWELHSHVMKQYLRIRETFKMPFDLEVRRTGGVGSKTGLFPRVEVLAVRKRE